MAGNTADRTASDTSPAGTESPEAPNRVLDEALAEDKREGLRLAVKARWIALGVIAILLPFLNPTWQVLYYEIFLIGFAAIGWAQLKVGRVGRSRAELFLMLCDLAFLTFVLVVPNPLIDYPWPVAMQYRFDNFIYFFVLLAGATLAYTWRTVVAAGVWTSGLWMGAMVWVLYQPVALPELSDAVRAALADHPNIHEFLDPNVVRVPGRVQEIVVFMIVATTLALGSWRTRRLLFRQAGAERERANLARYFPPKIVDQLAQRDQPLGAVRTQPVAMMFVDIVGFTHIAERQRPEQVVDTLREFHARMERAVFDHQGTLDKYLGDGLMASFGVPDTGPQDASNAVRCARDMVTAVDDWNRQRQGAGAEAIPVSIGVHYGDVVLGDIGSDRRLEFAVLGDAVNVASRLEELTRSLGVQVVASEALVESARAEAGGEAEELLAGFQRGRAQPLRGRDEPVLVWTYSNGDDRAPQVRPN